MKKKNQKLKKIIIVGAGGMGKEVLWTLMDLNKVSSVFDVIGFLDDDKKFINPRKISELQTPVLTTRIRYSPSPG